MTAKAPAPAGVDDRRFFAVMATDRPDSLALREKLRPAHRVWLREHPPHAVSVVQGGPTLDAGGSMNGTLLIVEAASLREVHDFVAADPYSTAGLFAQVLIRPWQWSLGRLPVPPPQA